MIASATQSISGEITTDLPPLVGNISAIRAISGNLDVAGTDTPVYEGEYEVTPSIYDDVVLNTEGYKLLQDIIVRQVQETISATDDGEGNVTLIGEIAATDNDGNISL